MAKQINFEVQVMQGGRWTISARYGETEKKEAVEEAKRIDSHGIGAVRVLRDAYDTDSGMSNEHTIYQSGGETKSAGGARSGAKSDGSGGGSGGGSGSSGGGDSTITDDEDDGGDDYDFLSDKPKKKKGGKQTSFTGLIVKLMLIILLSIGLAASVVVVMSPYIEGVNMFGTRMTGAAKENTLIMTFLLVFLVGAIGLSSMMLMNTSLKKGKARPLRARKPAPQRPARPVRKSAKEATPPPALPSVPVDAETRELPTASETDSMEQFREDAADGSFSVDVSPEAANAGPENTDEEAESKKLGVVLSADDMPGIGEAGLSPHAAKQKAYMLQFTDKAMKVVGKDKKSMSNFDKFGVSLFLAGACETLGQKQDLSEAEQVKLMADSVQTMGFKRSHAKSFAGKYEEYLVQDASYMQMFQAGRNALATYLTDESRLETNVASSMAEWNKPKVKEAEAGPITVLFTDIAGSTAMTQDLGDAGAQQVVRAHNRVVREALTMWNGKEVKHTGDGIMASFVKTSDSLDAAMQMQRETAEYTAQNQDKPLHLKIGINAGEPISEDNDLFGSTVQMSARIVDKAQADEIFVSEIVRGICAGKSYNFKSRGTYPMKGFDIDPILYEVVWKE